MLKHCHSVSDNCETHPVYLLLNQNEEVRRGICISKYPTIFEEYLSFMVISLNKQTCQLFHKYVFMPKRGFIDDVIFHSDKNLAQCMLLLFSFQVVDLIIVLFCILIVFMCFTRHSTKRVVVQQ